MSDELNVYLPAKMATRRQVISGSVAALGFLAIGAGMALAAVDDGILRAEEAIHQEPVFKSSRQRVYDALTAANQFGKVVQLSAAMQSGGMKTGAAPVTISREAGGTFSAFGGYITGRQVELVPNERIVQVWRAGSWDPGSYSIVRFVLVESGGGTKIVFDHTGFPKGQAEHLAEGWRINYWEPLAKFLA
ncbi:MAG TPA: SRPBCC domain-containing protein [Candidatus Baltobacteraceae bacterium]|nr:SRPBCC domain-containing protein [Candidatus Baltobacteraceae bacterium]